MNLVEKKWWHILEKGGHLSRQRFATKAAAEDEIASAPETWPRKSCRPVEVTYTYEEWSD